MPLLVLAIGTLASSGAHAATAAVWPTSSDPLLSLCLATRPPVQLASLWASWSLAPEIVLPLLASLALYARSLSARGGFGRQPARASCFLAGWLLLVVAVVSPLCRMAATLAWAHMVQHVILVALAPPLLVLGVPAGLVAARSRPGFLAKAGHRLRQPAIIGALYAAVIWAAHAPLVYEAALRSPIAHLALVATLLAVSLTFWSTTLRARSDARSSASATMAIGVLLCFSAMVQTGLLGALLTLSDVVWYPILAARAELWGLTPLEDQQLAGAIMWVPMSAVYLVAALGLMRRWLEPATAAEPGRAESAS